MNELRTAIYNKSQEASNFKTSIGGRFYFDKAPQGTKSTPATYPYVVAHEVVDDYEFTFQEDFERVRVQFNIYSNCNSASESGTIFGYLKDVFDWGTLSVSGYMFKKSERIFSRQFWDETKDQYVYVVDYNFLIQKNG